MHLFNHLDSEIYCHHSVDIEPNPNNFYMHVHEHMELFYLISGDVEYIVEGTSYKLSPGSIILARAGEAHMPVVHAGTPYERISIQFAAHLLKSVDPDGHLIRPLLERSLGQQNLYPTPGHPNDFFMAYFSHFDRPGYDSQKRVHILSILLMVLDEISYQFGQVDDREKYPDAGGISTQLINSINEDLFEDISLSSISRKFFLSESQVNRVFKKATGSSVWEYIRIKRLLAAREKILAGENPSAACFSCGFQDYSTFYRAYKAHFGVSPSKTNPIPDNICVIDPDF